jgi:hypothetical protein
MTVEAHVPRSCGQPLSRRLARPLARNVTASSNDGWCHRDVLAVYANIEFEQR